MILPTFETLLLQPPRDMDPELFARFAPIAIQSRADGTLHSERSGYNALARFVEPLSGPPTVEELLTFFHAESQNVGRQAMRERRKAASLLYKWCDLPNLTQHPLVKMFVEARMREAKPGEPKAPILDADLEAAMRICELDSCRMRGLRDAAVLAFLRHSAMRGSEVEVLDFDNDIRLFDTMMGIRIRKSKGDQFSDGCTIWVKATPDERFCPLAALRRWREAYHGKPLFCGFTCSGTLRRGRRERLRIGGIISIVKKYMEQIGHNPDDYGSHSGRSGYVTEGYRHNVPEAEMLAVTRHKSVDVLRKYRRYLPTVYENVAERLGR
jgi:hypothetical protein